MNFDQLIKHSVKFYPALVADAFLPRSLRKLIFALVSFPLILSFIFILLYIASSVLKAKFSVGDTLSLGAQVSGEIANLHAFISSVFPLALGIFFISFAVWLFILAVESFYNFYSGLDLDDDSSHNNPRSEPQISFEAGHFILTANRNDLSSSLLLFPIVFAALKRFEVDQKVMEFLQGRRNYISDISLDDDNKKSKISLANLAEVIAQNDKDLSAFLSSHEITIFDFKEAVSWIETLFVENRKRERWWAVYNLGRIPGIGKDWSYGEANFLRRFASSILVHPSSLSPGSSLALRENEVTELEKVLSRSSGANAIVVGDTDDEAMEVIAALGKMIANGSAMPAVEHKEMLVLDHIGLLSSFKDKASFELAMRKIMLESVLAGNIILVVEDLPAFMSDADKIGANLKEIIDPFLASPDIQFVATSATNLFHSVIETDQELINRFEKISIGEASIKILFKILEKEAVKIEYLRGVFFTYPALKAIVEAAQRYFVGSSVADKMVDLLLELIPTGVKTKGKIIRKEDVEDLVRIKTGVPVGEVTSAERQKLIDLEKVLSERIVGQKEAIKAIATAMRRARAGISNPNRPIGSFLFLGPTGVGKTETTKALASVFFGGEDIMHRIDMSEYNTDDSLEKLIGSFGSNKPGVLSSMLRDRPYGVLLLDEFEKTSRKVMDLFLQILDEGFFSDMSGKRVSARNLIIIATSNAGSELIWNMVQERGYDNLDRNVVINYIVKQQIFRPEFLNRFDGVIVFHPLSNEHLSVIASLMLKKLAKRLAEKGVELPQTPELISALVRRGSDPKFGARPMQRAIQDTVEAIIAEKMIKGEIGPGSVVQFSEDEIKLIAGENSN